MNDLAIAPDERWYSGSTKAMESPIEQVRSYRAARTLDERLALCDAIICRVAPDIRVFLLGTVPPDAVADLCQESLVAITKGLLRFEGSDDEAFFAFCYTIVRHKIADYIRRRRRDERVTAMGPDELRELIDGAAAAGTLAPEDRLDLDEALRMLGASKPECRQFLWNHYVAGFDYGEIASGCGISYDSARMKIGRCLELAQTLIARPQTSR